MKWNELAVLQAIDFCLEANVYQTMFEKKFNCAALVNCAQKP